MSRNDSDGGRVPNTLEFDSLDELEAVAERVPDVTRQQTESKNPETNEMEVVSWRDTLWTDEDDPQMAGNVSSNREWYHVIQYGDILKSIADALRARDEDIQPSGHVSLSRTRHRMTGRVDLDRTIEAAPGDEIALDLRFDAGHSGSRAVSFQVGAVRQICTNGMKAFVEEASFRQTHQQPLRRNNVHDALSVALEGDAFEERLSEARERSLRNRDEALLVILDVLDADYLFKSPMDAIRKGLDAEVSSDRPSLYETYQAATWALSHACTKPDYIVSDAHEDASLLLEQAHDRDSDETGLPDPSVLGPEIVESRANTLIDDPDSEERFDGERDAVRNLMTA
jgi:hypothetical protein